MAFKLAEAYVQVNTRGAKKTESMITRLGKQFTAFGVLAGAGISAASVAMFRLSASAEQTRVQFEVLTGSAEKAKQIMEDLSAFSARTPLQSAEIQDAARSLIAFGVSTDELIPTLQAIGDISQGIGAPLGEIAEIYGKARVQGRLFMEDVNQLTGRGIPIIGELAKQFGVAEAEVRDLVSSGKVGFANIQQAFQDMTAESGQFGGMMEKMSQTANGKLSTIMDIVKLTARDIGANLTEAFNLGGGLDLAITHLNQFRDYANFIIGNWTTLWGIAQEKVVIFAANSINHISAFATNAVRLGQWFVDNWRDVLTTVGSMFEAVFRNVANNVQSALQPAQTAIAETILKAQAAITGTSQQELDQQIQTLREDAARRQIPMKGLLDGFQSSINEMPNFVQAAVDDSSPHLKELQDQLNASAIQTFAPAASASPAETTAQQSLTEQAAASSAEQQQQSSTFTAAALASSIQGSILSRGEQLQKEGNKLLGEIKDAIQDQAPPIAVAG